MDAAGDVRCTRELSPTRALLMSTTLTGRWTHIWRWPSNMWANYMFRPIRPQFSGHQSCSAHVGAIARQRPCRYFASDMLRRPRRMSGDPHEWVQIIDPTATKSQQQGFIPVSSVKPLTDLLDDNIYPGNITRVRRQPVDRAECNLSYLRPQNGDCKGAEWVQSVDLVPADVLTDIGAAICATSHGSFRRVRIPIIRSAYRRWDRHGWPRSSMP